MKKLVLFPSENFVHYGLCQQNMQDSKSLGMKLNLPKMHCITDEIVFCSGVLENGF